MWVAYPRRKLSSTQSYGCSDRPWLKMNHLSTRTAQLTEQSFMANVCLMCQMCLLLNQIQTWSFSIRSSLTSLIGHRRTGTCSLSGEQLKSGRKQKQIVTRLSYAWNLWWVARTSHRKRWASLKPGAFITSTLFSSCTQAMGDPLILSGNQCHTKTMPMVTQYHAEKILSQNRTKSAPTTGCVETQNRKPGEAAWRSEAEELKRSVGAKKIPVAENPYMSTLTSLVGQTGW